MAVTKREADGADHPASHYLVVEDPAKPTTWHLRYKNAAGTVDRALCGACYAALTSNYRGNPYGGPNKEQALTKLRGIYKSQGWDWPGDARNSADDPVPDASAVTFTADFDGPASATFDDAVVVRTGKLFEVGDYPDKFFSLSSDEMQHAIDAFTGDVPLNLSHVSTVLEGKLGRVARIWADGTNLMGEVHLPKWLDRLLDDGSRKVSAEWDRATKTLRRLSLVPEPRVPDAALMAAFSADAMERSTEYLEDTPTSRALRQAIEMMAAFAADRTRHPTGQYAREDTGDGQQAMQHIHDVATAYGARQGRKRASTAAMSSTHEVRGFQSIHDTASTHGAAHSAACTPATMSTDQPRSTRMKLTEFLTGKAKEEGVEIDDLEAAFSQKAPDLSAVQTAIAEKDAKIAALEAAQQQQAAQFARLAAERLHSEAAAFAQGLVQSHRVPPGAAESLAALAERVMAEDSTAMFADGVKSTAALLAEFAAALPDYSVFTTHAIKDSQVAALFNTSSTAEPDGLDKDTIDKLLALTPDGKAMLAERK